MELKRYHCDLGGNHYGYSTGDWVRFKDVEPVLAHMDEQVRTLTAALAEYVHPHQSGTLTERERDDQARQALGAAPALHSHSHQLGSCAKCHGGRVVYIGQGEYQECNECASPAALTDAQITEKFDKWFMNEWRAGHLYGDDEDVARKAWDGAADAMLAASPADQVEDAREPAPSLNNPLTPYGMLVRALRIVANTSLYEMAQHMGTTPSQLSSMEFGRKEIAVADSLAAAGFFESKGIPWTHPAMLAAIDAAMSASKAGA